MKKKSLRKPSKEILETLGENIRTYRRQKNISQESLADSCSLHRTYIGSVERGERNVTLSTLEVFSEVLGISLPKLLTKKPYDKNH